MSELYDEIANSVIHPYRDLKKLNPRHELLGLIELKGDGSVIVKDEEFDRRYWAKIERRDLRGKKDERLTEIYSRMVALSKFKKDLEQAIREEIRIRCCC